MAMAAYPVCPAAVGAPAGAASCDWAAASCGLVTYWYWVASPAPVENTDCMAEAMPPGPAVPVMSPVAEVSPYPPSSPVPVSSPAATPTGTCATVALNGSGVSVPPGAATEIGRAHV